MTHKGLYKISDGDSNFNGGSAFKVPTDSNLQGEGYEAKFGDTATVPRTLIHINNGWDVAIDVKVRGSDIHDKDMGDATQDGQEFTIAASDSDFVVIETGWAHVDVEIDPQSAPSNNDNNIRVVFESNSYA